MREANTSHASPAGILPPLENVRATYEKEGEKRGCEEGCEEGSEGGRDEGGEEGEKRVIYTMVRRINTRARRM